MEMLINTAEQFSKKMQEKKKIGKEPHREVKEAQRNIPRGNGNINKKQNIHTSELKNYLLQSIFKRFVERTII